MDSEIIACPLECLKKGDYLHRVLPGNGAVLHFYRYFLRHLMQLVSDVNAIKDDFLRRR